MFRIFIVIFIINLAQSGKSQVVISPEVGLNYRPYTLRAVSNEVNQNKFNYYLALRGEVNLFPKFYMQTRIAYMIGNRSESGIIREYMPFYKYVILINREILINFDLLYEPFTNLKLGGGLGMIHKLNSHAVINYYSLPSNISYFSPNYYGSISVCFEFTLDKFSLSGRYSHMFKNENIESSVVRIYNDQNSYSIGLSYRLLGYSRRR